MPRDPSPNTPASRTHKLRTFSSLGLGHSSRAVRAWRLAVEPSGASWEGAPAPQRVPRPDVVQGQGASGRLGGGLRCNVPGLRVVCAWGRARDGRRSAGLCAVWPTVAPGRRGERRGKGTKAARTGQRQLIRAEPAKVSSEHRASVESSPKGRQGCYPPAWWHRRVSTRDARSMHIELAGAHACRRLIKDAVRIARPRVQELQCPFLIQLGRSSSASSKTFVGR